MAKKSEQSKQAEKGKRKGIISRFFIFLIGLPLTFLMTLVISIIIEWVGMYKFWPEEGEHHARKMLNVESRYLNKHFKASVMGFKPVVVAGRAINWFDDNVFGKVGIKSYKRKKKRGRVWEYIMAAYYICKVVILRICVILLSWPSYILFGIVGLITGLVERDLRRFGAGWESSDRYELSRKMVLPSIGLCFVVYLSWPNSINPAFVIVPFAASFGFSIHLTTCNYKKRL